LIFFAAWGGTPHAACAYKILLQRILIKKSTIFYICGADSVAEIFIGRSLASPIKNIHLTIFLLSRFM
jgi:hypothetical protein